MWEFNDTSRISILFSLREVKEVNRVFSFILNELNINYKLINNELSINYKLVKGELNINNASFKYPTILVSRSSIRSKLRTLRV